MVTLLRVQHYCIFMATEAVSLVFILQPVPTDIVSEFIFIILYTLAVVSTAQETHLPAGNSRHTSQAGH